MHIDLEPPYLIIRPGFTEEEFYRLADEDSDWEYLDGRIVMHSPASYGHEDLFRFLLTLFSGYLDERGGGVVLGSRFPMRLDPQWSPEPDLLVVRDAHRHRITAKRLEGPADLVVEILSESDERLVLRDKLPRYREAGIEEIWLVDPRRQVLSVEARRDAEYETSTLTAGPLESAVVPGLRLAVEWLWQAPLPSSMACLRGILG